jgi:hypothetical protein
MRLGKVRLGRLGGLERGAGADVEAASVQRCARHGAARCGVRDIVAQRCSGTFRFAEHWFESE